MPEKFKQLLFIKFDEQKTQNKIIPRNVNYYHIY